MGELAVSAGRQVLRWEQACRFLTDIARANARARSRAEVAGSVPQKPPSVDSDSETHKAKARRARQLGLGVATFFFFFSAHFLTAGKSATRVPVQLRSTAYGVGSAQPED